MCRIVTELYLLMMVNIRRSDVPKYLQNSALFEQLDSNDAGEFEVPEECFKRDLSFTCLADLRHYLHTFQFWGSKHLDDCACIYMYRNCGLDDIEFLQKEFYMIDVFTLVKRLRKSHPKHLISTALECGATVTFVAWLHEAVYADFSVSDCTTAAKTNNLPALKYLHEQGCPWDQQTIINAIKLGRLDCLTYAISNNCPSPSNDDCLKYAALFSQIEVLKYFRMLGFELQSETLNQAVAASKNLDCVRYLVENDCPMKSDALSYAAFVVNLACIQYLREKGCPWDDEIAYCAAYSGQLACLIYLHKHGVPFHRMTTVGAAGQGHLVCLQYAHTIGCPCTFLTYLAAVQSGSLNCVIYVAEHSPYPDSMIIKFTWFVAMFSLCSIIFMIYQVNEIYHLHTQSVNV